jgi:hypothetical protein
VLEAAPVTERHSYETLVRGLSDAERDALMRAGVAPRFPDLEGWEFDGTNTGAITDLLGIRKFKKGFYRGLPRSPGGPEPFLQGYNVVVAQNGLGAPHVPVPDVERARRHGFFRVYAVQPGSVDSIYPNALLLDYGLGGNGLQPSALLRDYLVQVYPDDRDLLLGRAFLALGKLRVPAGYFVLRRANRFDFGAREQMAIDLRGRRTRPAPSPN